MSAPQQSPEIGAACEPWDCDGSGLSRQGWSSDDGDQYGPCGHPCRAPMTPETTPRVPYYSDDLVTLYHGDCLEVREWLEADVLVTDPPYGMAHVSGWQGRPIAGDRTTGARDSALALWGARPAIVFGRWSEPRPEGVRARLVWDKGEWPGMGDLNFPWGPSDEEIYVLGQGFQGKREGTVLRANRLSGAAVADHPTPKPEGLMDRLIGKCPAGVVADPFAGSGTTLVAAKLLGRRAIGVELEERYCEAAAKRLRQDNLFGALGMIAHDGAFPPKEQR